MAKARHSSFDCSPGCSVEAAISLIDGKWKCVILWHLLNEGTYDLMKFVNEFQALHKNADQSASGIRTRWHYSS